MKKSTSANYWKLISSALILTVTLSLAFPRYTISQGYYKVEVRNTNCPVANHEADLWYFGKNAGMNFLGDEAVPQYDNWVINGLYGIGTISEALLCDSDGNLVIMSDGVRVWNRLQQVMPNGSDLMGDPGVTMPAIIIPKPGSTSIYYVFTVDRIKVTPTDPNANGLRFSEVDLSLGGGMGDVTTLKNHLLAAEVSEKITAVKKANGVDYWVVSHRWGSNNFIAFSVTSDGVDTNSVVTSSVGAIHDGQPVENNSVGQMKISPDGTKLALAIYGMDTYELFDFDNLTGKVTNPITSPATFVGAFGIEFSPDAQFLYTTTTSARGEVGNVSSLYQFDLNYGNSLFNNGIELATDNNLQFYCGLQLGTDGRIYVARSPSGTSELGVIYNPKRPGTECNFNYLDGATTGFNLGGKNSSYGLPTFIQSYFDIPHFDVEEVCFTDTTMFKLTNQANVQSVSWNFDDAGSASNTSTAMEPTHVFSGAGEYMVTVTENGTYTYQEKVIINELPMPTLPDTAYMYRGSPILLNAGDGFTSYEWSTGETSSTIKVGDPGTYYVTVQNERCCFNYDSVVVLLFDVIVPNAFRPGGVNNLFRAVPTSDEAINNFNLQVYNRWGQMVYESKDIFEGWDGNVKGNPAPGDVYVWIIFYDIEREGNTEKVAYKGNVVLLR